MTLLAVLMLIQKSGTDVPAWLPVTALVLAVTMYGAGVSPLPYIVMTEMLNFQVYFTFLLIYRRKGTKLRLWARFSVIRIYRQFK